MDVTVRIKVHDGEQRDDTWRKLLPLIDRLVNQAEKMDGVDDAWWEVGNG